MAIEGANAARILADHVKAVRERSQRTWNQYVSVARTREAVFGVITVLSLFIAGVTSVLALRYASTIVEKTDTDVVDRYGQLIGHRVSTARIPADAAPGMLITTLLTRGYDNYHSYFAMIADHNDAAAVVEAGSDCEKSLRKDWAATSTLGPGPDLTYYPGRPEQDVVVTSILDHGESAPGEEDYLVQFSVTVHGDDVRGDVDELWNGDVVLMSGGAKSDASPLGYYAKRCSVAEVKH